MEAELRRKPYVLLLRPPGSEPGRLAEVAIVAHIPVVDLEPLPGAAEKIRSLLGSCDWVAFTSPRAPFLLESLAGELQRLQREGSIRVAAVGPRTKRALEALGLRVDHVPREYRGAALARELAGRRPGCVLLPRSERAVPELAELLKRSGVRVVEVPLYRPVALDPLAGAAASVADRFDYVVFTSPSVAEVFARHYPRPRSPGFTPIAIGPTTARRLIELGFPAPPYPEEYTMEGVARIIEELWSRRGARSRVDW